MSVGACAPQVKQPELLTNIGEVHKAVEMVRRTTDELCELLRVGRNENILRQKESAPAPQSPLIIERCLFLSELRTNLYDTNERLQLILETLREI